MGEAAERKSFIHYNHFDGILEKILNSNLISTSPNKLTQVQVNPFIGLENSNKWNGDGDDEIA